MSGRILVKFNHLARYRIWFLLAEEKNSPQAQVISGQSIQCIIGTNVTPSTNLSHWDVTKLPRGDFTEVLKNGHKDFLSTSLWLFMQVTWRHVDGRKRTKLYRYIIIYLCNGKLRVCNLNSSTIANNRTSYFTTNELETW